MYKEKLDEIMYQVNNKAISTKILQRMDGIRNNDDEGQARRFVWELIQNAKDVAWEDIPLRIRMTLDRDKFIFAHNGKFFRMKNLLSLINQVSGKDAEENTTGKYGTGFFTTHQLSERVKVRGVMEDFGYEPKRFEVLLDRSGRTDEDIIGAVKKAMDSVKGIDDNPAADCRREDFNTEFEYMLETEYSRKVAEIGMNDACYNLFYCMAFVPVIDRIEIVDNIRGTNVVYTRGSLQSMEDCISVLTVLENSNEHKIVTASDGEIQAAAEISSDNCALPISDKTSRLFFDFPLIDNRLFPFPVPVNSRKFRTNEPRSCISLTDNPNSSDSEQNKRMMRRAVELYSKLMKYFERTGCKKLFNLINVPPVFKRSDLSDTWINADILNPIAHCIAKRRILPGSGGLFAAEGSDPLLPSAEKEELTEELNGLLSGLVGHKTITEDTYEWSKALKTLCSASFPFMCIKDVLALADKKKDIRSISLMVDGNAYEWLRRLLDCALKVSDLKNEIYAGNYAVFPTQSGLLKTIGTVYAEGNEIDEHYKDICDEIDNYCGSRLCIRERLIAKEYDISNIEGLHAFDTDEIGAHFRMGTTETYTSRYYDAQNVAKQIAACFSDERRYKTYRYLITDMPEHYAPKLKLNSSTATNSFRCVTLMLETKLVEMAKRSTGFEQFKSICGGEENAIDAINCLHELWDTYCPTCNYSVPILAASADGGIALKNIMPNCRNYVANDNIDDRLCEVYRKVVTDGAAIIDKRIHTAKCLSVRPMDEQRAAGLIGNRITAELKQGALFTKPKEFQAACSLLMRWINSNEEKARRLFPAYASVEDRMQLMTPVQAAEMSEQLDKVNDIMEKAGCKDFDELEKLLGTLASRDDNGKAVKDTGEIYGPFGYEPGKNNLDDVLERIGDRGEELAVELLKKQYAGAEVTLCNTETDKQQGYDIVVKTADCTLFYEVKTHTVTSEKRRLLKFSQSQAALLDNANYRVLLIIIDCNWNLAESVEFDDIFNGFSMGQFRRKDGYVVVAM